MASNRELVVRIGPDGNVRYRGSEGLQACLNAFGAELGPSIEDIETEIREEWTRVTPENSAGREAHESWHVKCPACGANGGISMYGPSEDATDTCHACGATIEFGVRVAEGGDDEA